MNVYNYIIVDPIRVIKIGSIYVNTHLLYY